MDELLTREELNNLKSQALEKFNAFLSNSKCEEEWRYTNLSGLAKKNFLLTKAGQERIDPEVLEQWKLEDCYHFVLINGFVDEELSDMPVDCYCCIDYIDHTINIPSVEYDVDGFLALNITSFTQGYGLNIFSTPDKPLQIIHITTQEAIANTRNLVHIDKNQQAVIIETFVNINNQSYLSNSILEVYLEENSELTLYKLQSESEKAYHFGGTYVKQSPNSRFNHHSFSFGALLARNEVHIDLDVASECTLNGLYLGVKRQHVDNHTRINHNKAHGISREYYKGILDDRARGVFQGRVVVAEDAQKTDSEMNNRNLLLSNDAEADTKPQLEIYADDVKCAHGVTVGQLEEKSIFYLQSRGIDKESARNVLTFAFANEMVDKVSIPSLKTLLEAELLKSLPIEL